MTTILLVRRGNVTCMASDGQVTNGAQHTVVKSRARKIRSADRNRVLVGFAGGGADALALFSRFEAKLEEHQGNFERAVVELAMDWRTDRTLRQLEAQMIVTDGSRSFLAMGNGDLLQPDDDQPLAIGSGGNYALAAARALLEHTELEAERVAAESMRIAADLCVYTNHEITVERLDEEEVAP